MPDTRLLFGGTFDPFHAAHRITVARLAELPGVVAVHVVVAGDPPHKRGVRDLTPAAGRREMVRAGCAGIPRVTVDDLEIHRTGPSYTIDTVAALQQRHGGEWGLVHGTDVVPTLHTWHRVRELLTMATLRLVARGGYEGIDLAPLAALTDEAGLARIRAGAIALPLLELSSTEVRERVATGRAWEPFVPDGVAGVIRRERLYR